MSVLEFKEHLAQENQCTFRFQCQDLNYVSGILTFPLALTKWISKAGEVFFFGEEFACMPNVAPNSAEIQPLGLSASTIEVLPGAVAGNSVPIGIPVQSPRVVTYPVPCKTSCAKTLLGSSFLGTISQSLSNSKANHNFLHRSPWVE